MMCQRTVLTFAVLVLSASPLAAQPATPALPAEYDVRVRYLINALGNDGLMQYFDMLRYLKAIGFQKDEGADTDPEDRTVTRLTGTIASGKARKLLEERHIKAILLVPKGAKLPDAKEPVRVNLELKSGFTPEKQRILSEQVRLVLAAMGFREAVGYDHRGYTRIAGTVPVGELDTLLADLRQHATGARLPAPFETVSPLVVIEVLPQMELSRERPAPPEIAKGQEKLTPEVRDLLAQKEEADKPARLEVILAYTPEADDRTWRRPLVQAAKAWSIEGRLGPVVTAWGPPGLAPDVAALPQVSTIRLARPARTQAQLGRAAGEDAHDALRACGLDRLHSLGHKGRGVRVAVIDSDFRGWQEARDGKRLPAGTRLVDLTAERSRTLLPEPFPGEEKGIGHGTQCALMLTLAAPEADVTLIRIDPASPHQLQLVARAINGEAARSESLEQRDEELSDDDHILERRREELTAERRIVLNRFPDLRDKEMLLKKKEKDLLREDERKQLEEIERYEAYRANQAKFDADQRAYQQRVERYLQLLRELRGLKGIRVVSSSLVWDHGHPVDGGSPLSRYFDDRPFGAAIWLQSAGNTRGQAWTGLFRDHDGNGVMEFAAPSAAPPKGRWTPELSFLTWQPAVGAPQADLPAGAKLRIAVQWREPHDPEFVRNGEDLYRVPLADLRLVLLRQRDPTGAKLPADDLEVVAQSVGLPQRLDNQPASAVYEMLMEFTVKDAGPYALRIEGRVPAGIRPRGVPSLPAQKAWELRPRIFIETANGAGRAVLQDYVTEEGTIGMPGDARGVITVGAADQAGKRQPYSAGGPPMNMELLTKPNVLAYDHLIDDARGTSLATGFAAGLTASALGAGVPQSKFLQGLGTQPGDLLRVPQGLGQRKSR